MDSPAMLRQVLRLSATYRTLMTAPSRPQIRNFALLSPQLAHPRHLTVPRILQPSFWASVIPRPFRERIHNSTTGEWNPATPYIVLAMLVGSQAIQMLWLKQERESRLRKTEAQIETLREVIEKVHNGEDVDVEKLLGTGDAAKEGEWKEMLKEIEEEEMLFQSRKARRALREAAIQEGEPSAEKVSTEPGPNNGVETQIKVESVDGARFY